MSPSRRSEPGGPGQAPQSFGDAAGRAERYIPLPLAIFIRFSSEFHSISKPTRSKKEASCAAFCSRKRCRCTSTSSFLSMAELASQRPGADATRVGPRGARCQIPATLFFFRAETPLLLHLPPFLLGQPTTLGAQGPCGGHLRSFNLCEDKDLFCFWNLSPMVQPVKVEPWLQEED